MPGEAGPDAVFALALRKLREAAQITQKQLAGRVTGSGYQMHQTTIAKIEAGQRPVTIGEAAALCMACGAALQDMFTEQDRARAEAQAQVRALEYELDWRTEVLLQDKILLENTTERLNAARRRLAGLGGELLTPGKDDDQ